MDFSTYNYRNHIPWYYKELGEKLFMTEYSLYHLKMLKDNDRKRRAKLYNDLDPNLEFQPIGYDYLYDLENIELQKIKFKNRYD